MKTENYILASCAGSAYLGGQITYYAAEAGHGPFRTVVPGVGFVVVLICLAQLAGMIHDDFIGDSNE